LDEDLHILKASQVKTEGSLRILNSLTLTRTFQVPGNSCHFLKQGLCSYLAKFPLKDAIFSWIYIMHTLLDYVQELLG
jgi:hypothetical protein